MTCRVVRRSRLRPEATCVACIAGLRCVAAIFTSLRCRRARWLLDVNVSCGRASACSFAMLVLRGPASEKAALHSWPDNASLACLHASIALYILVSYAGVSTPSEPKDSNSRPLCMIANSYFARLRMQHICKREGERRRCKFRLLERDRPVQKKTGFRLQKARFIAEWRRASLVCLHASAFYFATLVSLRK